MVARTPSLYPPKLGALLAAASEQRPLLCIVDDAQWLDVASADALIVVSPTFSASYSGLFKSFFDLFEAGSLSGVPTLLAATGGTERHSLVLEHALRPLLVYLLILSFGVRFIHFSLFGGTLLSLHYWLVDLAVLLVIGVVAYRYTLANQMVSQYYWLYERSGAFSWRAK